MKKHTAKFDYRHIERDGLTILGYTYRNTSYTVQVPNTGKGFSETLKMQHDREQYRIDEIIRKSKIKHKGLRTADEDLREFFKLIDD